MAIAMSFSLTLPECIDPEASLRKQNSAMKEAMRTAMKTHHRERIPKHFRADARTRYGHAERTRKYNAFKRRFMGSRRDLVKTGRTEKEMKANARITIGGTSLTGLKAKMKLRFGWEDRPVQDQKMVNVLQEAFQKRLRRAGGDRFLAELLKRQTAGVTLNQMRKEITTIRPDELQEFADEFAQEYAKRIVDGRRRTITV